MQDDHLRRIEWLDIARAISIILVVLGHSSTSKYLVTYIYSFHLPLFFVISGYLFTQKEMSCLNYMKNRAKTILVPYFVFSFLTYFIYIAIYAVSSNKTKYPYSIVLKQLAGIFYSNGTIWMDFNYTIWFLTCMFIVQLMFFLIMKYIKNNFQLVGILVASSIVGYLGSVFMPVRLPWSIDVAFTAIVFYGAGYLLRNNIHKVKNILNIDELSIKSCLIIITICCGINIYFGNLNGRIDMNNNYYNHYIYFYIASFAGIFGYLMISYVVREVQWSKLLLYIGRNTLTIFALHPIAFLAMNLILKYVLNDDLIICRKSLSISFLYTTFAIMSLSPIIYLINNYFPYIIGKEKKIIVY